MKKFVSLLMVLGIVSYASAAIPTTGLQLHLDASSLTGYSDGQTVASWADLSGNGNTATSAGTPTYIASAFPNGLPAISITGSLTLDGYSWTGQNTDYYSFNGVDVKTIAMVFKRTSNVYYGGGIPMLGNHAGTGWVGVDRAFASDTDYGTTYFSYNNSDPAVKYGNMWIDNGAGSVSIGGNAPWTAVSTDYEVMVFQIQNGWGSNLSITSLAGSPDSGHAWGMDVAEVLFYNTMLSSSDITALSTDLHDKYFTPEPMTMVLLGLGSLFVLRRRKA